MGKTATFIRTWANPMSVRDANGNKVTVPFNGKVIADYDYLIGMPGFELYEEEDLKVQAHTFVEEDLKVVEIYNDNQDEDEDEDDENTDNEVGLSDEDITYLKGLNNFEWNKMKKTEVIQYVNKINIDTSTIKDDRWEYIKFLKKIIKEL